MAVKNPILKHHLIHSIDLIINQQLTRFGSFETASIQMWAHYADNHKGIVIAIDENLITKDPKELIEVEYDNILVRLPVNGNPKKIITNQSHFKSALTRKEKMWAYESEVRFYMNLDEISKDGQYYKDISAEAIKEIYIGLRAHETTLIIAKQISQRENFKHIKLYQMELHPDEYKIIPKLI